MVFSYMPELGIGPQTSNDFLSNVIFDLKEDYFLELQSPGEVQCDTLSDSATPQLYHLRD